MGLKYSLQPFRDWKKAIGSVCLGLRDLTDEKPRHHGGNKS